MGGLNDISELLTKTNRRTHSEVCPFLVDEDGKPKRVHFQSMTAAEVLEVMQIGGVDGELKAIQYCLVDEAGNRIVARRHIDELKKVDGRLIAWLSHQITRHNLSVPDVESLIEDAEGN